MILDRLLWDLPECFMLVQTIVGIVECDGLAVLVPTDAVVVKLFLELVELVLVAVVDEETCFPQFCGRFLHHVFLVVACELVAVFVACFIGDNVCRGLSFGGVVHPCSA